MDLSKLPRLSNTPTAPADVPAPATPPGTAPTLPRSVLCDQCGAALRNEAQFCDSCGAPLNHAAAGARAPASTATPRRTQPTDDSAGAIASDIWFSLIVGVIFLFIGWNGIRYYGAKLTGHAYHTGYFWQDGTPRQGQEVAVADLDPSLRSGLEQQLLTDRAMLLFAFALLFDAAARVLAATHVPGRRIGVRISLFATTLAVGYNIYVAARLFSGGITPILSFICIALGGYAIFAQAAGLQALRRPRVA